MPMPKVKVCKFCKHPYIHPCDGKNKECGNAMWIRSGGKVNVAKPDRKKSRVRLDTSKPKRKRVKL